MDYPRDYDISGVKKKKREIPPSQMRLSGFMNHSLITSLLHIASGLGYHLPGLPANGYCFGMALLACPVESKATYITSEMCNWDVVEGVHPSQCKLSISLGNVSNGCS